MRKIQIPRAARSKDSVSRCITHLFVALLLLTPVAFSSAGPIKLQGRPNILIILADDLGPGDITRTQVIRKNDKDVGSALQLDRPSTRKGHRRQQQQRNEQVSDATAH